MKGKKSGYSAERSYNRIIPYFTKCSASLLIILIGIFLFPHLARLATISPSNVIELTNKKRQEHGSSPLRADQYLTKAARQKAKTILEEQEFKHKLNNKDFSYWIEQTPYQYEYAGENLAIDFQRTENVVRAWMDSAPHRKNLFDPRYQDIGVAAVKGRFDGHKSTIVVQILGRPDTAENTPSEKKDPVRGNNTALSSTTLEIASFAAFPSRNIFLIHDFYSRLSSFSFFGKNKFTIIISVLTGLFSYFYLYFLLSALKDIHTKNNKQ